jgi:hypothetical protein
MTKILHLTLKRKWFDMIASGEKKEEYREMKGYWFTRLCNLVEIDQRHIDSKLFKKYDVICFKNGYAKDAPMMMVEHKVTAMGWGLEKWGAEKEIYYIIKLGKILKIENYGENGKK